MFYASDPFDRADRIRKDDSMVAKLWESEEALVVPYFRGKMPVHKDGSTDQLASLVPSRSIGAPPSTPVLLGLIDSTPYFAVDFSNFDSLALRGLPSGSELEDLRTTGPVLSQRDGAMLAYTRAMMHWHTEAIYCSRCGHANTAVNAGHMRLCSNIACGHQTFPRTDPAVIMLIVDTPILNEPERCLLGRNTGWPKGVYSTLAGFVEPGETLENAVRREVMEEAGVVVGDVNYAASQPWPFPQSIMLGFRGRAITTEINRDPTELSDARWFSKDELKSFGDWGDTRYELQLPRPDSIARHLIDQWMASD